METRNLLLVILVIFSVICSGQKNGKYRKYQHKIYGGYTAGKYEFAHHVAIGNCISEYRHFFCGGSLISEWFVLTAAHCPHAFRSYYYKFIMVGSKYLLEGGDRYFITDVIVHPKWDIMDVENLDYDVSLLKTDQKVRLIPGFVEVIKLPGKNSYIPKINDMLWTCGFGSETGGIHSDILKKINLYLVSEQQCLKSWLPSRKKRICVVSKRRGWGTCSGDSGGGLIYKGRLVGLLSYGTQECDLNQPEVYTDIHVYLDWIYHEMKKYN